jgi:hypothetical protein
MFVRSVRYVKIEFRLEHFDDATVYSDLCVFTLKGNVVSRWLLVVFVQMGVVGLACAQVCVVYTGVAFDGNETANWIAEHLLRFGSDGRLHKYKIIRSRLFSTDSKNRYNNSKIKLK